MALIISRHLMMQQVKKENPNLKYSDPIFREAFVFHAMMQEGANVQRLANFTGMSKGEVAKHMAVIRVKLKNVEKSQLIINEELKDYDPTQETVQASTTDGAGVQPTTEGGLDETVEAVPVERDVDS